MPEIPEIINSDQGCQFTCLSWIALLEQRGITISLDEKGRWADNVFIEQLWRSLKYEMVYLNSFDTIGQARTTLRINHYNVNKWHQSLNYHTPCEIHEHELVATKRELLTKLMDQAIVKQNGGLIMSA